LSGSISNKNKKIQSTTWPPKQQKRQKEKEKVARFLSVDRSCAQYPAMKALERTDGGIRSFVRSFLLSYVRG
jgi:hypothetical protein